VKLSQATLRRRGWIVPLCVVLVVVVAVAVAGTRSASYRTGAVLAVPATGGPNNTTNTPPGTLATTYAELLGQDDRIAAAVGRATGLPASVARSRISAAQVPNTSIIDVTFSDFDASRSLAGARAVVASVTGSTSVTPSIPRGALQLVSAPGRPSAQGRKVPGGPIPVGIVLGLALGLAALLAWDRHDARVDDVQILEATLGVPATEIDDAAVPAGWLEAVQRRWGGLSRRQVAEARIVLISSAQGSTAAVESARERLVASRPQGELDLIWTDSFGRAQDGELAAMDADLVVLVVGRGERTREVRATTERLHQLGVQPAWAILLGVE
jgi:hypothetical protein